MPEPPPPNAPAAQAAARPAPARRQNAMLLAITVAVAVLALAVGAIAIFALRKSPAPQAVPVSAPLAAVGTPTRAPIRPAAQTSEPCRAIWGFDEESGTTAPDTTGNGNNATLVGDQAVWTGAAKVGSGALSLGGSSYVETPVPVVNTAQSFTVTAWVSISAMDKQHNQTVVSIDGSEISGFYLMLYHTGPKFVFNRSDADARTATRTMASASFNAVLNTWYHLAGVYDADAKTLSLYVNGKLEQTVPFDGAWQATGKTAIGRGFYGHGNCDFLSGTVDDVRLYSAALTGDQILALASK